MESAIISWIFYDLEFADWQLVTEVGFLGTFVTCWYSGVVDWWIVVMLVVLGIR